MERQAALRAAQTSSSQDPNQEGGVTEEMIRSLQQVGRSATHLSCRIVICVKTGSTRLSLKQVLVTFPSLCQEARNVVELQRTVQRGNTLLRRKEEQLQQLESSIADRVRTKHQPVSVVLYFHCKELHKVNI